jgi:hypothetical protein
MTLGGLIISENKELLKLTIEYLRGLKIFDEIVVVADTDNGIDIEESAKLADKYLLRTFDTPEKAIDDLCSLSTCDWQFRLDDDELVGENILNNLRYFVETADKDVYWLPRMWLWPDKDHFLNCYHWYPDHQIRLWKKGHLKAEIGVHMHPRPLGTSGILPYHLYHLVLLQRSYDERLHRCRHHADMMGIKFEHFLKGIGLFYLPEHTNNLIISELTERIVR